MNKVTLQMKFSAWLEVLCGNSTSEKEMGSRTAQCRMLPMRDSHKFELACLMNDEEESTLTIWQLSSLVLP